MTPAAAPLSALAELEGMLDDVEDELQAYRWQSTRFAEELIDLGHGDIVDRVLEETPC